MRNVFLLRAQTYRLAERSYTTLWVFVFWGSGFFLNCVSGPHCKFRIFRSHLCRVSVSTYLQHLFIVLITFPRSSYSSTHGTVTIPHWVFPPRSIAVPHLVVSPPMYPFRSEFLFQHGWQNYTCYFKNQSGGSCTGALAHLYSRNTSRAPSITPEIWASRSRLAALLCLSRRARPPPSQGFQCISSHLCLPSAPKCTTWFYTATFCSPSITSFLKDILF